MLNMATEKDSKETTWWTAKRIAIFALIISIASLYLSARRSDYERSMEAARLRTAIMLRLFDSVSKTRDEIRMFSEMPPPSPEVKDRRQEFIERGEKHIDDLYKIIATLETMAEKMTDPVKLEKARMYFVLLERSHDDMKASAKRYIEATNALVEAKKKLKEPTTQDDPNDSAVSESATANEEPS